ncbi:hypothetical protein LZ32DRAFT_299127 [Colletotrichum eremochloae]|nr:hypothetical protein LZ32DRAFT_299127 [Colletotrichum eremochloae]
MPAGYRFSIFDDLYLPPGKPLCRCIHVSLRVRRSSRRLGHPPGEPSIAVMMPADVTTPALSLNPSPSPSPVTYRPPLWDSRTLGMVGQEKRLHVVLRASIAAAMKLDPLRRSEQPSVVARFLRSHVILGYSLRASRVVGAVWKSPVKMMQETNQHRIGLSWPFIPLSLCNHSRQGVAHGDDFVAARLRISTVTLCK